MPDFETNVDEKEIRELRLLKHESDPWVGLVGGLVNMLNFLGFLVFSL